MRCAIVLHAVLFGLASANVQAQTVTIRGTDPVTGATVNVGDAGNSAIRMRCMLGCAATTVTDRSTFTFGTTSLGLVGGVFDDTPPSALTTGMAGVFRSTARRALHVNLRDSSGNEIATLPVSLSSVPSHAVTNAGTFAVQAAQSGTWNIGSVTTLPAITFASAQAVTQSGTWTVQPGNTANTTAWLVTGTGGTFPVTGTFWQATQPVSGPLTDTQLRATAVPVSGTFFQATQPVSAASLPLPSGAATSANQSTEIASLASLDGKAPALGQALAAASLPVVLTAAQLSTLTPPAAITGFATSAKQDTGNTSMASIDGKITAVNTGAVVVASSALPSGAATAAKQPALGTAGTASADVLSIQGIASGTAVAISGTIACSNCSGTGVSANEDAASANGDPGTPAYTVRQDALSTTTTTDGDYQPIKSDAAGRTYVTGTGGTFPVTGTFWQATQPVSLVSVPLPSGAATSADQVTGNASLASIDGKITAVNTGAVVVASSALPTGAATAAKQPALGTPGTASADVLTIQGIASMTALKVDGSAVTQPVSAASLPLPSGAATGAKQDTGNTSLASIDGKITAVNTGAVTIAALPNEGQQTMANSISVALASNQSAIPVDGSGVTQPVSASSLPLPSGAATLAEQQTQTTALQLIDNLPLGQGSTTSGQSGVLVQGAVTTSAPSYTTAQTSPLSLTTAGALRTDGSAVTQPVSAATLPLPSGAATAANQATEIVSLSSLDTKTPALGQALAAASVPVVLTAAQIATLTPTAGLTDAQLRATAVPVSGTVTANAGTNLNTSALALSATQTDRTQKTQITDGTRDGTVKAASTTPLLTDTALVTTQRDPIPAGTNVIGHVIVDTAPTTAVTGPLTDAQLRATPVPVSGTVTATTGGLTDTQLRATAVPVTAVLTAGAAVIGHVIADTGSTTTVTGNVATTVADGADVTLGAKADAKSTATDTTAISAMSVLKQISASVQAPPSQAVTNAGTFAVQNTQQGTASQNVAQLAGTTTDTNSGNKSAGTLRVVLATDQPALTNKLLVTPDANSAINVAQVNGVTTQMGTGAAGTGTQRVAVASDSSLILAAGSATIGALTANQSVNVAQINGVTTTMGNGVSGTGVQRVTLASDSTGQVALAAGSAVIGHVIADSGSTTTVTQATASSLNAQVVGAVASAGSNAGNPVKIGGVYNSTQPTVTNGQIVDVQASARGAQIVATGADTFNATINAALPAGTNNVGLVGSQPTLGTSTTITWTGTSITNGNARESTAINNTSTRCSNVLVNIITKGQAGATASLNWYVYTSHDGTNFTDGSTGTDAAFTAANRLNARFLGATTMNTTNVVSSWFELSDIMRTVTPYWGLIGINNSGGTLSATAGDHVLKYVCVN